MARPDYSTVSVPALNLNHYPQCLRWRHQCHSSTQRDRLGEGQHSFVVIIAGVDTPLLVSRHKVKNDALFPRLSL